MTQVSIQTTVSRVISFCSSIKIGVFRILSMASCVMFVESVQTAAHARLASMAWMLGVSEQQCECKAHVKCKKYTWFATTKQLVISAGGGLPGAGTYVTPSLNHSGCVITTSGVISFLFSGRRTGGSLAERYLVFWRKNMSWSPSGGKGKFSSIKWEVVELSGTVSVLKKGLIFYYSARHWNPEFGHINAARSCDCSEFYAGMKYCSAYETFHST